MYKTISELHLSKSNVSHRSAEYLVFCEQSVSGFSVSSIVLLRQKLILLIQPQLNIIRLRQILTTNDTNSTVKTRWPLGEKGITTRDVRPMKSEEKWKKTVKSDYLYPQHNSYKSATLDSACALKTGTTYNNNRHNNKQICTAPQGHNFRGTSEAGTRTHTRLTALFLGLPGWAGTRKVKTIWVLLA